MEGVDRLQLGAMGMKDGWVDAELAAPRLEFAVPGAE